MNKQLQQFKYILLDVLSASLAWFLFFIYRKQVVEPQLFGVESPVLYNAKFWTGIVSISIFWLLLYTIFGYYRNVYRKSRLIELGQTLIQCFFGVLVIFFVALLDDLIPSYKNYYSSVATLFCIHFSITYIFRFLFTSATVYKIHNRKMGFKTLKKKKTLKPFFFQKKKK